MANSITWGSGFPSMNGTSLWSWGEYTKDAGWNLDHIYLQYYGNGPIIYGLAYDVNLHPTTGYWSGSYNDPAAGDYNIYVSEVLYNPQTHQYAYASGAVKQFHVT